MTAALLRVVAGALLPPRLPQGAVLKQSATTCSYRSAIRCGDTNAALAAVGEARLVCGGARAVAGQAGVVGARVRVDAAALVVRDRAVVPEAVVVLAGVAPAHAALLAAVVAAAVAPGPVAGGLRGANAGVAGVAAVAAEGGREVTYINGSCSKDGVSDFVSDFGD